MLQPATAPPWEAHQSTRSMEATSGNRTFLRLVLQPCVSVLRTECDQSGTAGRRSSHSVSGATEGPERTRARGTTSRVINWWARTCAGAFIASAVIGVPGSTGSTVLGCQDGPREICPDMEERPQRDQMLQNKELQTWSGD
ncbi:hypothetical protein DPEC_G00194070 [Dallia pectoralis]|uniref:Uncharacterized protein n=1 Tax=Dallia pectoralis TaxID=75939 RepID=A0ACC2G786_DALPE|nr:hypothetical protein DPEC_G00194070 [Dallia pectoralis]